MTAEPRLVRGLKPWSRAEDRLRATRSMILSTTRPDGRPHAIPTWYWWGDGRLYFITARNTQKARNLRHQPSVIAHFGDGDDVLFVEGTARIVSEPAEQRVVDEAH